VKVRAPVVLRYSVKLHGDVPTAAKTTFYATQLQSKAIASRLDKCLLQAPYAAKLVLLLLWAEFQKREANERA
jgi:hypothetical protein